MMRLLVGGLIVVNVLVFLYSYLGLDRQSAPAPAPALHQPDMGSIRLISARVSASPAGGAEGLQENGAGESTVEAAPPAEEKSPLPDTANPPGPETASVLDQPLEEAAAGVPQAEAATEPEPPSGGEASTGEGASAPGKEGELRLVEKRPVLYCGEAGPFLSRGRVRRLVHGLKLDKEQYRIQRKPTPVNVSFWVLRPPLPDRASARQEVARLKEAGVRDLWLMQEGRFRNGISLGLYTREESARSHAEKLRAKGFEVEVRPRQKMKERYWLTFYRFPEELVEQLQAALPAGSGVEKKVCEASSGTL